MKKIPDTGLCCSRNTSGREVVEPANRAISKREAFELLTAVLVTAGSPRLSSQVKQAWVQAHDALGYIVSHNAPYFFSVRAAWLLRNRLLIETMDHGVIAWQAGHSLRDRWEIPQEMIDEAGRQWGLVGGGTHA